MRHLVKDARAPQKMAPVNDNNDDKPGRGTNSTHQKSAAKHPFFMAPAERVARQLSQQIEESNALNRAIQINLISEEEDSSCTEKNTGNGFFQKRAKVEGSVNRVNFCSVKLKKIGFSTEPPPFPQSFQLIKEATAPFEARMIDSRINKPIDPVIKQHDHEHKNKSEHYRLPLAKIIRDTCAEMDVKTLEHFNTLIRDRSLAGLYGNKRKFFQHMTLVLNDIEINLSSNQPVIWVFTGPPGVGKTSLVDLIVQKLDLRLVTVDSTNGPRNAKTFETLQTTLTHSAPRSFSQFFCASAAPENKHQKQQKQQTLQKQQKVALLFDEVEIAFENDRGYWSALSSFLNSSTCRSAVPIFITSNASQAFLETIIKFPEYTQFVHIQDGDYRQVANNSDFINRLHCIDTSMEYEHFALSTGYHKIVEEEVEEEEEEEDCSDNTLEEHVPTHLTIREALRWGDLIQNMTPISVHNPDIFEYSETASLADLLLSVPDPSTSVKMNLDPVDNLQSEFFAFDLGEHTLPTFPNTLLYSNLPEIYSEVERNDDSLRNIARELLERTINHNMYNHSVTSLDHHGQWIDLSRRLSKRFFDYTRSLQSTATWASELTSHVALIENEHESCNRGRRKKAYYRYLGDDLLNDLRRKTEQEV